MTKNGARGGVGGLTFRVNIATVFTGLVLLISGSIIWYTYDRNTEAVLDQARRSMAEASSAAIRHTEDLLEPAGAIVSVMAALGESRPELARSRRVFPMLVQILRENPELQSVYYAFEEEGRFLQAFTVPRGVRRYGPNDTPMHPDVAFALRELEWGGAVATDYWQYIDDAGATLDAEFAESITYDARERPWYQRVRARAEAGDTSRMWTEVVVFTSSQLPGIAPAVPMLDADGRYMGAAAANITLESMSGFLQTLLQSSSGSAFIMDGSQRLVAFPDASRTVRQNGGAVELVPAETLHEEWIANAVKSYRLAPDHRDLVVATEDGAYLATFTPFPKGLGRDWTMAAVAPVDAFVAPLKVTMREIIALSVLVTLVGMILIAIFSQWISRPLRQMVLDFDRLRDFDLQNNLPTRSHVREIQALSQSLLTLKTTLQTFSRYVPKELVRDLISSGQPITLGGHSQHVTILFTDIAGFTQLSERTPTRNLMLLVSSHLDAVARNVLESRGTIDKYIGDSVMAFWGAPVTDADHAANACRAALMSSRALERVNQAARAEGRPELFTRMGLHTDAVMVGNIGSMERMSYTVIGDGANVAARLEGANRVYGTQILTSHAVFRDAGDRYLFRPLDIVTVKGRREPVRIYELLAGLGDSDPDLVATDEQKAIAALTAEAFNAYLDRDWDTAEAAYRNVAALAPNDRIPVLFLARMASWRNTPPPDDWSAVHDLPK